MLTMSEAIKAAGLAAEAARVAAEVSYDTSKTEEAFSVLLATERVVEVLYDLVYIYKKEEIEAE